MSHSTMLFRKTAILPTDAGEDRRRSHKFFLKFFEKPVVLISPIHAPNAPAQARDAAHVNRGKRTPSKNFRKNLLLLRLPHLASVRRTAVFRAWYNEACSLGVVNCSVNFLIIISCSCFITGTTTYQHIMEVFLWHGTTFHERMIRSIHKRFRCSRKCGRATSFASGQKHQHDWQRCIANRFRSCKRTAAAFSHKSR